MNLQFYLEIAGLTAIFFFIILALYGIALLAKFKKVISRFDSQLDSKSFDLKTLEEKVKKTLDNAEQLSDRLNNSLDALEEIKSEALKRIPKLDEMLDNTNELIKSGKQTSDTYNKLGTEINQKVDSVIQPVKKVVDTAYNGVYKPVNDGSRFINALYKGISIFTDKLSGKK